MDTLLSTKFNTPPLHENLVTRLHLFGKLDQGLQTDRLLTLVCAPAGYGKTTLVSGWLNRIADGKSANFAWLTLDEGDDDLVRFLSYLIAAIQQSLPDVGRGIIKNIQTPKSPNPVTLATWLINDLTGVPEPIVLVLDDYHKISAQPIHEFLSFLIDHQPPRMNLVIVSRSDPPFALARLRARGQLVELRQEDLSFSLEETGSYLKNIMGLNITADQLAVLENRTEGWIAGLQLAALSMRNVEDISSFIAGFSGGHVHIADFLMDEVLAQQAEPVKEFLLQTSILERLSGPLCEAVTGQPNAQEILEKLKDGNLFLVSLDYQKEWYRYHALFADLLRKRLHQTNPNLVDDLHQLASQWFAASGQHVPAIEHALSGHDYRFAAGLIEEIGETVLKRGELFTLLRWLETLPEDYKQEHPVLFVYYGLVLLMSGKPPAPAEMHIQQLADSKNIGGLQGEVGTFQALLAIMKGNAAETASLSRQALQQLAPEKAFFRSLAADSLGMAYTLLGDTDEAIKAFEQAVSISEQSGNTMMLLGALANLAGLQALQGKLRSAHAAYQRIMRISAEQLGKRFQLSGKASLGLGMLSREWNDLEGALQYYEEAEELLSDSVEIGLPIVYLSIAFVKLNQGDMEAAQNYLDKAHRFSQASTLTPLDDILTEETQTRFWIAQGKLDQAREWLQAKGFLEPSFRESLNPGGQVSLVWVMANQTNYFNLARFYLADNQPASALDVLKPLSDFYRQRGHMRRVIEVLILIAIAHRQSGEIESALQVLEQALSLAEPEGYIRTFLDEGEPMAQLLYTALSRGLYPEYIGRLLAAYSEENFGNITSETKQDVDGFLIEPLSEREQELLELIAEGLSNQEIAARLHISLSTVKTHVSHIFSKLNASSRTQAVAKARSLGLLPIL